MHLFVGVVYGVSTSIYCIIVAKHTRQYASPGTTSVDATLLTTGSCIRLETTFMINPFVSTYYV